MNNDFFDDIDFRSIAENIKTIYTNESAISVMLDFERVLDDADLYAYQNWIYGELTRGPIVKKYHIGCTFMYPYTMMPDPRGAKRLLKIGCDVLFKKTTIEIPMKVKTDDDFLATGNYPKKQTKKVWMVYIRIPKSLIENIREGSKDVLNATLTTDEIDNAYADERNSAEGTPEQATESQPNDMELGGL